MLVWKGADETEYVNKILKRFNLQLFIDFVNNLIANIFLTYCINK